MNKTALDYVREGLPCDHEGCLSHISHPCEGCGRVAGRLITKQPEKPEPECDKCQDGGVILLRPEALGNPYPCYCTCPAGQKLKEGG